MSIDFDSLFSGAADDEYVPDDVIPPRGLVVAERAKHGNDLVLEAHAFLDSTRGLPMVVFVETSDTDPNVEIFANAEAYRIAMDRLTAPTIKEALAWEAQRISERLAKWAPRLDELDGI